MEKEMLFIVATLEKFWCTLHCADHHVFTNHKNLMFDTLKTQCVLRWHTKIEECSPMLHYIKGPRNILANDLSRLHCFVTLAQISKGMKLVEPAVVSKDKEDKAYFLDKEYSGLYYNGFWECMECYLNLPKTPHPDQNLRNYSHMCELQQQDELLLALQSKTPKLDAAAPNSLNLNAPCMWWNINRIFPKFNCPMYVMKHKQNVLF